MINRACSWGLKEGVGVVNDVTVGGEEERCGDVGATAV